MTLTTLDKTGMPFKRTVPLKYHSPEGLHHIGLGVRVARKGWLRRQDIFNTRSVGEVEAFLKTPKAKR